MRSYAEKVLPLESTRVFLCQKKLTPRVEHPVCPQMVFSSLWPANDMQSLPSLMSWTERRTESRTESQTKSRIESWTKSKIKVPTYLMSVCRTCPTFGQGVWMRVDRLLTDNQNFSWTTVKIYLEINKLNYCKYNWEQAKIAQWHLNDNFQK